MPIEPIQIPTIKSNPKSVVKRDPKHPKPETGNGYGQQLLVELAVLGKMFADMYARTKSRWWLGKFVTKKGSARKHYQFEYDAQNNRILDPKNKETNKLQYERFLTKWKQFMKEED